MSPDRPRRLDGFSYRGLHRYHLRLATWNRARYFDDPSVVALAHEQLFPFAARYWLAVHAYCFMPDHVHVLLAGTNEAARLRPFVAAWKQHTGYEFARAFPARLWQPGYFERVLREEETNEVVAGTSLPTRCAQVLRRVSETIRMRGASGRSREEQG